MTNPMEMINGELIEMSDADYATFQTIQAAAAAQQAALLPQKNASAAISSGIVITSTGTPALNGTYPLDQDTQGQLNGVITFILINGTFPNGISEMPWYDTSGAMHLFPSVAAFKDFATAFANYVATVTIYANSGGTIGSIPSNNITIA